ncbi:MAG TPA: ArdC-like ssDNA-binding domain-containing protein [Microterricola sp.]
MDPQAHHDLDAKLAELHERLAASVEALVTGDEWKQALEFATHFRSRSFNNTLLIWSQHDAAYRHGLVPVPVPSYVAGFKQWQTLDRHVVAGQKGYMVFAPVNARFATSTPADPSSWRRLNRNEKPRPGEIVRPRMVGVRPAYVWDVSQTDGTPLPAQPTPQLLSGEAPTGLGDGLAALVRGDGFNLSTAADATALGGANGMTDFGTRVVTVRADMDAAARVKTLAHELAHIRLHEPNAEALPHRGIGEVEAESVALMIGSAHGMDTIAYTIPYVSTWATTVSGKTAVEVVQATGERVRRAAVAILDQLPTAQSGASDPPGLDRSRPVQGVTATVATAPSTRAVEHLGALKL